MPIASTVVASPPEKITTPLLVAIVPQGGRPGSLDRVGDDIVVVQRRVDRRPACRQGECPGVSQSPGGTHRDDPGRPPALVGDRERRQDAGVASEQGGSIGFPFGLRRHRPDLVAAAHPLQPGLHLRDLLDHGVAEAAGFSHGLPANAGPMAHYGPHTKTSLAQGPSLRNCPEPDRQRRRPLSRRLKQPRVASKIHFLPALPVASSWSEAFRMTLSWQRNSTST